MQLLPVVAGAIVPHAPLLLPELESPEVAAAALVIRVAISSLAMEAETIVILTPHASQRGVYGEAAGNLSAFGVRSVDGRWDTDPEVIAALGMPRIDGPVDHGVLVPLLLARWEMPVVAVGVDGDPTIELDMDRQLAIVASVNLSAGLTGRAPLTALDGAVDAEAGFLSALERDVAEAASFDLPGSCGASIMSAFGRLFEGRRARVLAHQAPVGVGYLVAEVV